MIKMFKKAITIILFNVLVMMCAGCGTSADHVYDYGVFISVNAEDVVPDNFSRFKDYEIIVLDVQNGYTGENIASLKAAGHAVYSYINIGSAETYRDYYEDFENITLGRYENWPDESWVDVSSGDWQDFILTELSERLISTGIDGFFVDNVDVYYQYPTEDVYCGIETILKGLKKKGNVIINGGDTFVREYYSRNGDFDAILDGVNQESVFSRILDYDNNIFGENEPEEREYFEEYVSIVASAGKDVYLLEYTEDEKLAAKIRTFCRKNNYKFYISDKLDLS